MYQIRRSRDQLSLVIAGILIVVILIAGLSNLYPDRPPAQEIPASEQLRRSIKTLQQTSVFKLTIEERGPGYYLLFQGQVEGMARVTGYLEDFQLEVMLEENQLYIKKQGDTRWQTAEKLQLERLDSFLLSPLQILNLLDLDNEEIIEGDKILVNDISCRTFVLQARKEDLLRFLFPEVPFSAVQAAPLTAVLAEGNLKKITIQLELTGTEDNEIRRIYTVN